MDTASLIGAVLEWQACSISIGLMLLSMLLLLRIVLRSVWLAACGFVLVNTTYFCLAGPRAHHLDVDLHRAGRRVVAWILVRFGLLASRDRDRCPGSS